MPYVLQDPEAVLDYAHIWDEWLADGESIVSHLWTITPSATLVGETTDTVFVSDLQANQQYLLTEHVVTSTGTEDERTIVIHCQDT